jgi:glutamine amidotransferase
VEAKISAKISDIEQADKLILPGVGAFDAGMQNLEMRGLLPVLNRRVLEEKVPILGLCLGMQLFSRGSEEGQLPGLGWIDANTVKFNFDNGKTHLKIPHMGWNSSRVLRPSPLWLEPPKEDPWFYFVHSYYVKCNQERNILATTTYGEDFTSMVIQDNIVGTQFHPEKSHRYGMELMKNFAENAK